MIHAKNVKVMALALLIAVGLGGSAVGISYAAGNTKNQAGDVETQDDTAKSGKSVQDNGKDGETKDDTKPTSVTNVQDNGQDGETSDSPNN